jgi:hypothetical protein
MPRFYFDRSFRLKGSSWSLKELASVWDSLWNSFFIILFIIIAAILLQFLFTSDINAIIKKAPFPLDWCLGFYYYLIVGPIASVVYVYNLKITSFNNLNLFISLLLFAFEYLIIFVIISKIKQRSNILLILILAHPLIIIIAIFGILWLFKS